jgi:hypothetical protein
MPDAFNRPGWLPDDRALSLLDSRKDSVAFEAKIRHMEGLATTRPGLDFRTLWLLWVRICGASSARWVNHRMRSACDTIWP